SGEGLIRGRAHTVALCPAYVSSVHLRETRVDCAVAGLESKLVANRWGVATHADIRIERGTHLDPPTRVGPLTGAPPRDEAGRRAAFREQRRAMIGERQGDPPRRPEQPFYLED